MARTAPATLFRFALPLCPTLLHHLGNAFAGCRAHVAARTGSSAVNASYRSATAARSRSRSFQGRNGSIKTIALSLEIIEYVLNIHASPFDMLLDFNFKLQSV
jgi:hypothetical protein